MGRKFANLVMESHGILFPSFSGNLVNHHMTILRFFQPWLHSRTTSSQRLFCNVWLRNLLSSNTKLKMSVTLITSFTKGGATVSTLSSSSRGRWRSWSAGKIWFSMEDHSPTLGHKLLQVCMLMHWTFALHLETIILIKDNQINRMI